MAEDALEIRVLALSVRGSHTNPLVQHLKEKNCAISNMSDTEGPDSSDLPKVMECRWSFIYLETQIIFY